MAVAFFEISGVHTASCIFRNQSLLHFIKVVRKILCAYKVKLNVACPNLIHIFCGDFSLRFLSLESDHAKKLCKSISSWTNFYGEMAIHTVSPAPVAVKDWKKKIEKYHQQYYVKRLIELFAAGMLFLTYNHLGIKEETRLTSSLRGGAR